MKKLYALLIVLLLTIGFISACGSGENTNNSSETSPNTNENGKQTGFPVKITDAVDKEVTIENKPEKIVSLIPSNTEIAFALNLGDEIVGVSENDTYPKEVAEKEKVGGMEYNVEKIISLDPDLVLAHESNAETTETGLQQIRDAGITVVVVNDAKNFNEVYDSIELIGEVTGEKEAAKKLVSDMETKVEDIKEQAAAITEQKKVYMEISPAPDIFSAGKNTFMDEMLSIINAENVVKEEGWPQINQEAIIASNPDVIVTTYGEYTEDLVGQILNREGWQDVNAVKNKQVFDVNADKVTRSGPRLVEGVEELAKAVYPDVFK